MTGRLHAEISLLHDRIEQVKRRWGANAYTAMVSASCPTLWEPLNSRDAGPCLLRCACQVAGDMATVNQHLDIAKAEMESLMLEVRSTARVAVSGVSLGGV